MAEEDVGQSRSEEPTPRRREEARRQGQVAYSAELANGVLLLIGFVSLWYGANRLAAALWSGTRFDIENLTKVGNFGVEQAQGLVGQMLTRGANLIGIFLATMFVAGLAVSIAQVGFAFNLELVGFNWNRLNPVGGFGRMFSLAGLVRGGVALAKVAVVGLFAYFTVRNRVGQLLTLNERTLVASAAVGWDLAMRVAVGIAFGLLLLGVADYFYQRFRLLRSLRMTRQELREELKREEGDPQIRARIRRLQREMAQRRMLREVPRATVVVTNPTHLAVALAYERGKMAAPRVVAKGSGPMARRIMTLARRSAVPVLERKPLARGLYRTVPLEGEVPPALFLATAEVLAFVYRLRGLRDQLAA
jgi:flagellar biosynthetic protein FlhB